LKGEEKCGGLGLPNKLSVTSQGPALPGHWAALCADWKIDL